METERPAVNEGWEERAKDVCQLQNFIITIYTDRSLVLSEEEHQRLATKLRLVGSYAQHMAMNMAKGTIKYPSDTYDSAIWIAEEADDAVDHTNLRLLRLDALHRAGLI